MQLDYSLKTKEERTALVQKIIDEASPSQLTPHYLEILGDYILEPMTKEEKKNYTLLTKNRLVTINKRETSYEDLVSKFENGEDGLYNLIINDKNVILTPKVSITQDDINSIPGLKELRTETARIEEEAKRATGMRKFKLKKQAIQMHQDQYVLKNMFKQPIYSTGAAHGSHSIQLNEKIWFDEEGEPHDDGLVSLFNPKHISAILCNYALLDEGLRNKHSSDFHYLLEDFDVLLGKTLKNHPILLDIVQLKIAGKQNIEIQKILEEKYQVKYSVEYLSSLWRNKIPKMLADRAREDYILWYYTEVEVGNWKKCSCCGQIKLAHNRFFSKNKASKDGWYSICKECRNKKYKEKRGK